MAASEEESEEVGFDELLDSSPLLFADCESSEGADHKQRRDGDGHGRAANEIARREATEDSSSLDLVGSTEFATEP
jgi:hypothetical protein